MDAFEKINRYSKMLTIINYKSLQKVHTVMLAKRFQVGIEFIGRSYLSVIKLVTLREKKLGILDEASSLRP